MKNFKMIKLVSAAFVVIAVTLVSCGGSENIVPAPVPNLAQIVAQSPRFSMLSSALVKAGLDDELATTNNVTLFAPDNAAFQASGITNIDALTPAQLQAALSYHLVGQVISSTALPVSDTVKTLSTLNIFSSRNANGTFANGIRLKDPDVQGSNGVIHVVERVLPLPTKSIFAIASEDTTLSFLATALTKLGLNTTASGPGKFTVFAPTNQAFRDAGITDVNAVPNNVLEPIVKYHLVNTNIFSSDFTNNMTATTLQGGTVTITTTPSTTVKITGSAQPASAFTETNIIALNGVIHKIGRVMIQ